MKKRAAALALCLALALALAPAAAEAAGSVYITAAGNDILPLDDATMPFWSDGYLYVASSIFTGQVNKSLGVAYLPSSISNPNLCILYTGNNRSLMFDLSGNFVRDSDGNISFRGAIRRGGEIFVPASVVAEFFKLEYSVTPLSIDTAGESSYGALVWLRQPNFGLSEKDFINAAFSQISMRYEQYLRERQPEDSGAETPPAGVQLPGGDEKSVYLCLTAGEGTAAQLDALDACGAEGFQNVLLVGHMGKLGNLLLKKKPDFDPRNYGFSKLSKLIRALDRFEIVPQGEENTEFYVRDTCL